MFRWLFMFLLLANAILLLWFSLQVEQGSKPALKQYDGVNTLRLVTEMEPAQLQRRVRDVRYECTDFIGFARVEQADAVVRFLHERGYVVQRLEAEPVQEVVLAILLPEGLDARLRLVEYLETQGSVLATDELLEFEYLLTGFADRSEAEQRQEVLRSLGLESEVRLGQAQGNAYTVRVIDQIDRKLSNEIKEIVQKSYSLRKIEKKLCKGVAKL
ncbi:hypothetical protein [Neptuniibacter halophilus]|uniref:hypothetical protein n=1 Tax=Neptuniibacter halophilus TaxID=651666 RepID=UPI0025726D6D|nr:hypothetical protein [Neptuniibacter halophilus]